MIVSINYIEFLGFSLVVFESCFIKLRECTLMCLEEILKEFIFLFWGIIFSFRFVRGFKVYLFVFDFFKFIVIGYFFWKIKSGIFC